MAAIEPFTVYEPGPCDLDMIGGFMKVEEMFNVSLFWNLTGHRSGCKMEEAKPWPQLAIGPVGLWIPLQFASSALLLGFRQRICLELKMQGIANVKPYHCAEEGFTRPFTVVAESTLVGAYDLGVALKKAGVHEVSDYV